MSDISIPGVSSKYGTTKLIEDLMKVERIPKERAEEKLKGLNLQNSTWLELNQKLSSVRESARSLFSYQNPFNERIAKSSDESVLTASASREAIEETKTFVVKQVATADRFMSSNISNDFELAAGNYVFGIGEDEVRLKFSGGKLKDFTDALNKKGNGKIRAQLISISKDEKTLVIESLKTGSENRLSFKEDAIDFALKTGIIEETKSSRKDISVSTPVRFESSVDKKLVKEIEGALNVAPFGEAALKLSSPISSKDMVLEFEVELKTITTENKATKEDPITGPSLVGTGSIEYEGIRINSASTEIELPEIEAPKEAVISDDFRPIYIIDNTGSSYKLPQIKEDAGYQKISIPVSLYSQSFSGIGVKNGNSKREVNIRNIKVSNPLESSGTKPKNPVDTAGDSIIKMDGITITRQSNTISDLVPGLNLELWQASDKPVKIDVQPDRESVKESLIEFVGNYNRLVAEINILSRNDEKILSEISYFTDDEKKAYKDKLGLFQGDTTLTQLKNVMQRTMMDNYPTSDGIGMLANFGISTDTRRGGSYDASRLRGYLEIDEKKLDQGLKENFETLKAIMGYDTDNDLLIDNGAAFKLESITKAYVETGGIVSIKTNTLKNQISRQEQEIESLETQLTRKEDDLKRKYGQMESSLNQMEKTSSSWDTFNKQNIGNSN